MEKIKADCSKCGRSVELPGSALAKRRLCAYCGGALTLDPSAHAAVEAAAAAAKAKEAAAKLVVNIECPACGRRARLKGKEIGTEQKCLFCSCPFVVPEPGKPLIPGPAGCELREEAPVNGDDSLGLEQLFAPLGGWKEQEEPVPLALNALRRRLALGHAAPEDGRLTAGILFNELYRRAQAGAQHPQDLPWMSPLPTAWSGDLIAHWICRDEKAELSERPGDKRVVAIETGRHVAAAPGSLLSKEGLRDAVTEAAIDYALQAVTDGALGFEAQKREGEEYVVRHFLQIEVEPAVGGSNFGFSHVWASGETHPLEEKQKDIIRAIRAGLGAKTLPFLCMKSIFGSWLNAHTFQCLDRARFGAWLKALDPALAESPVLDRLAAQGKN